MSTAGSKLLASAVKPRVMPAFELANKLGVSQQTVSHWVQGRSLPSPALMAEIETLLGIPMRSWTEPAPKDDGEAA